MGDYLMSLIKANNITNTTGGIPTVKSQQLIPTAWVNFNGTGTVAIQDSENVSSITDNGIGDYTITFATAMANANYSGGGMAANTGMGTVLHWRYSSSPSLTTTAAHVRTARNSSEAASDSYIVSIVFMGGQA